MKKITKVSVIMWALLGFVMVSAAYGAEEVILKKIKPTLTGWNRNNAFVMTSDKVGPKKKKMTIFRRNQEVPNLLVAAKGGIVWGADSCKMGQDGVDRLQLSGDAHIAIDGDTEFIGNLDYDQSIYTFLGTVRLSKHIFSSDESDPLVFRLDKDKGFVYMKGKGKVIPLGGKPITIP